MTQPRDQHRFDELAAAFVYLQRSPNTQAAYRRDLDTFAAWCATAGHQPLRAVPDDLDRYREACEDAGASASTVARRLSSLNSFFAFAVAGGAMAATPVASAPRPASSPSPTTDLTSEETEAFVRACGAMGPKTVALVGLLLVDGLRLGEVLAADVEDLVRPGSPGRVGASPVAAIRVDRHGTTVELPLDPQTGRALALYLGARRSGPLLQGDSPTREPARLTRFGADYLLKRAAAEAGLDGQVSANTLRRRFVAAATAEGRPLEEIQERMGHADVRTTRRHLGDGDAERGA